MAGQKAQVREVALERGLVVAGGPGAPDQLDPVVAEVGPGPDLDPEQADERVDEEKQKEKGDNQDAGRPAVVDEGEEYPARPASRACEQWHQRQGGEQDDHSQSEHQQGCRNAVRGEQPHCRQEGDPRGQSGIGRPVRPGSVWLVRPAGRQRELRTDRRYWFAHQRVSRLVVPQRLEEFVQSVRPLGPDDQLVDRGVYGVDLGGNAVTIEIQVEVLVRKHLELTAPLNPASIATARFLRCMGVRRRQPPGDHFDSPFRNCAMSHPSMRVGGRGASSSTEPAVLAS